MRANSPRYRAITLVLLLLATPVALAQSSGESSSAPDIPDDVPPPERMVAVADAMYRDAQSDSWPLVAHYNATSDPEAAYAIRFLLRAEQYAATNHTWFVLERVRDYYPAAAFARLQWEVRSQNLSGPDAVDHVINWTDVENQRAHAEKTAARAMLLSAQRNATSALEVEYLLYAAVLIAEGANQLDQYSTFRGGLLEEGDWHDTLVQGTISYSHGVTTDFSLARRIIQLAEGLDGGDPVTEDTLRAMADAADDGSERYFFPGLDWYKKETAEVNGTGEHIYRVGIFAAQNGTRVFNEFINAYSDGAMSLTEIAVRLRSIAAVLVERGLAMEDVDAPMALLLADASLFTTEAFAEAPASQKGEFQNALPAFVGRSVTALTLLNMMAMTQDDEAETVESGAGLTRLLVPALVVLVVVAAGAAAVVMSSRRS